MTQRIRMPTSLDPTSIAETAARNAYIKDLRATIYADLLTVDGIGELVDLARNDMAREAISRQFLALAMDDCSDLGRMLRQIAMTVADEQAQETWRLHAMAEHDRQRERSK